MDDAKKLVALADLKSACETFAKGLRDDYDAMPVYTGVGSVGLLGGSFKADGNGKPWAPPWETTPLRTLALHPDLARDIALKYGVPDAEILELGAWNLPDNDESMPFAGYGASTYFARLSLSNAALSKQAFSGWRGAVETQSNEAERAQMLNEQKLLERRNHMRSIQQDGAIKTAQLSGELADAMVSAFNREREKQPTLADSEIFTNVAITLNNQKIKTLQGRPHTQDSVRRVLAKFRSQLARKA